VIHRHKEGRRYWQAAVALLVWLGVASSLEAALQSFPAAETLPVFSPSETPTLDPKDAVAVYLGREAGGPPVYTEARSVLREESDLSALPLSAPTSALRAPALVLHAPADPQPPVQLASFAYPEVSGLSQSDKDERAVPYGNTALLVLGPGGFGRIMTGRPPAAMENWTQATETAISYVRPHVNVQMMLALEAPGGAAAPSEFEGPGLASHAYLAIDHETRVNSLDVGASTPQFGRRPAPTPVDEPQTAVAVGLDLGLLPTFLSQMGVSVSIVASRGQETGSTRLALVGTMELPVDWVPRERPYQHPVGLPVNPLGITSAFAPSYPGGMASSSIGGGDGGGGEGEKEPLIPITPVPEPGTLALVGSALAAILAAGRRRR